MTDLRSGRRILAGAIWGYGSQVLTIIFQLGYAAVVSRLAGADEFGAYSVALSITALISLLANGGMSQAVARLMHIDRIVVGAMFSFALILGVAVAVMTFITAPFWADLWGADSAGDTIRWLSISALLAPTFSLLTGIARRKGHFPHLASATVTCNVVGMVGGVLAVASWGTAASLVASAVLAQGALVGWLALRYRSYLLPRSLAAAIPHVAFSTKLVLAGTLQYAVGNIGKWSATRAFGAPVMGEWNRAEVLTTIPMQQLQTAMVQAVYPEFRHDVDSPLRAKAVWADMLLLVAWLSVPMGIALAVFAPIIIPLVLGPAWIQAAQFSIPLAVGVAIQPVSVLLASALEALGSFRRIWLTDILLLGLQLILVFAMIALGDVSVVVWGIAVTNGARLLIHCLVANKIGYLDLRKFARGGIHVLLGCIPVFLLCKLLAESHMILDSQHGSSPWLLGTLALVTSAATVVFLYQWRKLPPVRLAVAYGILRKKESK